MNRFTHTIQGFRKSKGLTQWDLARELGCTENYIYLIEAGQRIPSQEFCDLLSTFYSCNPEWLTTLRINAMVTRFGDKVNKGRE